MKHSCDQTQDWSEIKEPPDSEVVESSYVDDGAPKCELVALVLPLVVGRFGDAHGSRTASPRLAEKIFYNKMNEGLGKCGFPLTPQHGPTINIQDN